MWRLDNRTPFAAERGWVRDRNGAEIWLVAVKCTVDILHAGATRGSDGQPPVLRAPEYHGEPGQSSIKFDSDLILTKTTTDVLAVGHAYAPGGKPVTELDVGVRVGPVQKVLKVFGNRQWDVIGRATAPQPTPRRRRERQAKRWNVKRIAMAIRHCRTILTKCHGPGAASAPGP